MAETRDDSKAASELDPELVRLPRARTRVRPIMALAIMAICLTIGLRLISDLRFSRQSEQPHRVASISELSGALENRFIEMRLRPDRPQAVRVSPKSSTVGELLVPVQGSGGKLWLLLPPTAWTGPHSTDELYRGRLSRLASMDFYDTLTDYLRQGHIVPKPVALTEIRTALQSGSAQVRDVAGDSMPVTPNTTVRVREVAEQKVRVRAISSDSYDNEAAWRLALENAGVLPPESAPTSSDPSSWTFEVPAPDGLEAIRKKLVEARLFAATADEISTTREGTWSELSLDGQDIVFGTGKLGYSVHSVSVGAVTEVPADAFLLNTTEQPSTYWYVLALVALLAAFMLLFAFGLWRSRQA